jgi:hypothetical protein
MPRTVLSTVVVIAVLTVGGIAFGRTIAHGQAPHDAGVVPDVTNSSPALVTPTVTPSQPSTASPPSTPTASARPPTPRTAAADHTSSQSRRAAARRASAADTATLIIVGNGSPCYVEVTSRGHVLTRTILHGKHRLRFDQRSLHVVLGNAGGVTIAIRGQRPHRAGHVGQVRRFTV